MVQGWHGKLKDKQGTGGEVYVFAEKDKDFNDDRINSW